MTMRLSTQPYRGARDFYPDDMRFQNYLFSTWRNVCKQFGYEEYDGPLLESTQIYEVKSGEEIVGKELYSFTDKGNRRVAIRPEMTPTLARMIAAKMQELSKPIRWFSIPNLWRYEKPQKGRLREHYQLNVDVFGVESIAADFEIIQIAIAIMEAFGAKKGQYEMRVANRRLIESVYDLFGLSAEKKLRVGKIIDKSAKISDDEFATFLREDAKLTREESNSIRKYLEDPVPVMTKLTTSGEKGAKEISDLLLLADQAGIGEYIRYDPRIMRGFDYYTGNVFEQFDLNPDNNRSMYGGGRYDDLVEVFNGQKLTGIGFGFGDVTLKLFLENWGLIPEFSSDVDVFVPQFDPEDIQKQIEVVETLRRSGLNTLQALEPSSLKKQLAFASKKRIPYVLIQGSQEREEGVVQLKDMNSGEQNELTLDDAIELIKEESWREN